MLFKGREDLSSEGLEGQVPYQRREVAVAVIERRVVGELDEAMQDKRPIRRAVFIGLTNILDHSVRNIRDVSLQELIARLRGLLIDLGSIVEEELSHLMEEVLLQIR